MSVCPWTSSFRKMDSPDDRELIFGLGWGLVCCGNEVGRVHFSKKMDSSDDRELIFGWNVGDLLWRTNQKRENGLVQQPDTPNFRARTG